MSFSLTNLGRKSKKEFRGGGNNKKIGIIYNPVINA